MFESLNDRFPKNTYEGHLAYTRADMTDTSYDNGLYYAHVLKELKKAKIQTMIDVGGCVGEATVVFFEHIPTLKHSHIIEPIATNVAFMRGRFLNNEKVTIHHKALLYGNSEVILNIPSDSVGGANIYDPRYDKETVETITLEDLPKVDFIKIDVEGCELNIIESSQILKKTPFVEVEFHHHNNYLGDRQIWMTNYLPHSVVCQLSGRSYFMKL